MILVFFGLILTLFFFKMKYISYQERNLIKINYFFIMRIVKISGLFAVIISSFMACINDSTTHKAVLNSAEACRVQIEDVALQLDGLSQYALSENRIPRTLTAEGEMHWTSQRFDWTEGFFPGSMWLLYNSTQDPKWKDGAEKLQGNYADHRFLTSSHDLGFVFNCSYGNSFKYTNEKEHGQFLIDAANSLITRYNPAVGCIKSWDVKYGWQSKRDWQYPVIIDNMMNLELLFEVAAMTGDTKYSEIAITHANITLANHFRPDWSSYHVVDYDSISGTVRAKETAQGYAHESAWARGQAWGLYGYTVCYRYTKDPKYLAVAEKIVDFIMNNENLPEDKVPFWDFNAPKIPNEPRDASAAAIIASAMLELDNYSDKDYLKPACEIIESLSGYPYRAKLNENKNFVLKHSVGSIPHNAEIDVPLNYADYYYIEALTRLETIMEKKTLVLN